VFPRRQPSFRLHFVQGTVVTEYQVTNVSHPEFPFWKADPEPYEKRVAGMDVSLDLRRVGIQAVQNLESWTPRFHFARNGQTTTNWQAEEIIFEDATGNKAHSLTELCRQEEVVKVSAKLFRKREAEFSPEETWSIPDLVVPEPGKAVALSLSNRLQGVTLHVLAIAGVGETTYSNNVPVAATAQISIDTRPRAESVWIDHPGRRPNADSLPSVFIKSSGPDDLMPAFTFVGRSDVKPLTVVSGVPHVAVSVKGLDNERRVFLKGSEEIRSSYFPVQGSRRPNEPYFLPLKDTVASKKLTLVFAVQKSVKVEFFVKTPPRQVPEK